MKIRKIEIFNSENLNSEAIVKEGFMCIASDVVKMTDIDSTAEGYGSYFVNRVYQNHGKKGISYVDASQRKTIASFSSKKLGVRLSISFDDIIDFDINKIGELNFEYPLFTMGAVASKTIDSIINQKANVIYKTGRKYYVNHDYYDEYELYGIRFIMYKYKAIKTSYYGVSQDKKIVLSDGTSPSDGDTIYLTVEKIPFVVDTLNRRLYSNVIIQSTSIAPKNNGEDSINLLTKKINKEFLSSINDELDKTKPSLLFDNEEVQIEHNRYGFDFSNITEEEIVETCINCGVSVFLHGRTGTGKTQRMKALDKDLEIVDFGCTREDGFVGIIAKDATSNELTYFEPYWYKNLVKKCNDKPNNLHILFLDELTNANKDLQKVAFEVSLERILTNCGFRLSLPKNSVVVAAGNESTESRSASPLSAPLFSRFAHVYIDTKSEEWINWATNRKNKDKELLYNPDKNNKGIHPAIVDYIKANGDNVLTTPYNGKTPNADPRKWELASKALYECNNPNVLRAFIGKGLTCDFIEFCQMNLITLDDVLNDNWTVDDIPNDSVQRSFIVSCLTIVDDENVEKVRRFVEILGKEYLAKFDYEWSKDNPERILKLYTNSDNPLVRGLRSGHR